MDTAIILLVCFIVTGIIARICITERALHPDDWMHPSARQYWNAYWRGTWHDE